MRMRSRLTTILTEKMNFILLKEQFVKMASPDYVLKRGYSLAMKDGKIVKHAVELCQGDEITTRFADGDVKSIVE